MLETLAEKLNQAADAAPLDWTDMASVVKVLIGKDGINIPDDQHYLLELNGKELKFMCSVYKIPSQRMLRHVSISPADVVSDELKDRIRDVFFGISNRKKVISSISPVNVMHLGLFYDEVTTQAN